MFTKAIVHIGLQKTGSTTLQAQAHANQRHLSKQLGIHYPSRSSLSTRGNHSYSLAAMFPTSDSVTAEGERFRRDYEDQFAQCADPVVMLSAEGVAGFGAERLRSFRSWLSSVASEVVFVAVVVVVVVVIVVVVVVVLAVDVVLIVVVNVLVVVVVIAVVTFAVVVVAGAIVDAVVIVFVVPVVLHVFAVVIIVSIVVVVMVGRHRCGRFRSR